MRTTAHASTGAPWVGWSRPLLVVSWLLIVATALPACGPDETGDARTPGARETARRPYVAANGVARIYFTRPGVSTETGEDPEVDDAIIEAIRGAKDRIDLCLYELDHPGIVEALREAAARGVTLRMVGDGDEIHDDGYEVLQTAQVPMTLRPAGDRIMHNKFVIIDDAVVFTGSMNFSFNGVMRNNNHALRLDSPAIAAVYRAEFEQMYLQEKFGRKKTPLGVVSTVPLGDTETTIYFSPQDRIDEKLRGLLATADVRVYFMVFSFTHQDIADDLIALHQRGVEVMGVFDVSQARNRYAKDEYLAAANVPVLLDGNEHAIGFAGGKLHHKVMIIDPGTDSEPIALVGSYNWSQSGSRDNDENVMVLRGAELVAPFMEEFCRVLEVATPHPEYQGPIADPCAKLVTQVRINELLPNPAGTDRDEEFIELVNTGATPVSLEGWTLGDALNPTRHVFGADAIIAPGASLVVYSGQPAGPVRAHVASSGQLSLNNNVDTITLRDPQGVVVDQVTYEAAPSGVSFNRSADGGDDPELVLHDTLGMHDSSPGARFDGTPWIDPGGVFMNEVQANPAGTEAGQEFIELVNSSDEAVDLSGWTLEDAVRVRHTFAPGATLAAGRALVVFDAGDHSGIPNAIISSTGALGLNNSGDTLTLRDAAGVEVDTITYGATMDGVSLNRAEDGDRKAAWIAHDLAPTADRPASPGDQVNGAPWGDAPANTPRVRINELLPNPIGTDLGAEFIELVNTGDKAAQLEGWRLSDATGTRHVFGSPLLLLPGESLVVFDRGEHGEVPGSVLVSSTRTLSLNNGGDRITLSDASGVLVDEVRYLSSEEGVSLNRADDGGEDPTLVAHTTLSGGLLMSPNLRASGAAW